MAASFAVARLAREVALVLALPVAAAFTALVVGAMARADGGVVLRAPVSTENVLRFLDVQLFEGHRFRHSDLNVKAVAPLVQRRSWTVALRRNEPNGADVQPFQGRVSAQPDGETALTAGHGLAVFGDLEQPLVGDGKAELATLAGAVGHGTTMRTDIPMLGFLAFGFGSGDAFQPLGAAFFVAAGWLPRPVRRLPGGCGKARPLSADCPAARR